MTWRIISGFRMCRYRVLQITSPHDAENDVSSKIRGTTCPTLSNQMFHLETYIVYNYVYAVAFKKNTFYSKGNVIKRTKAMAVMKTTVLCTTVNEIRKQFL